jgi:hypothetical protein
VRPDQADEPTSILMLSAPGTPREHYEERPEWFIKNDNFFIE